MPRVYSSGKLNYYAQLPHSFKPILPENLTKVTRIQPCIKEEKAGKVTLVLFRKKQNVCSNKLFHFD
jgi:hypothetical protein